MQLFNEDQFYSQELDRISTKMDSMSMFPPERRQSARPSQRGVFGLFGCLDGCGSLHPVVDRMDVVQRFGRRVLHGPVVQRMTLRNVTITIPEYVAHRESEGERWNVVLAIGVKQRHRHRHRHRSNGSDDEAGRGREDPLIGDRDRHIRADKQINDK